MKKTALHNENEALRLLGAGVRSSRVGDVIRQIESGFGFESYTSLKAALGVSTLRLAEVLGMSDRNIARHQATRASFSMVYSDRLYRVAFVLVEARTAFNDEEVARTWLLTPQRGLGKQCPFELLKTEAGSRQVVAWLVRAKT